MYKLTSGLWQRVQLERQRENTNICFVRSWHSWWRLLFEVWLKNFTILSSKGMCFGLFLNLLFTLRLTKVLLIGWQKLPCHYLWDINRWWFTLMVSATPHNFFVSEWLKESAGTCYHQIPWNEWMFGQLSALAVNDEVQNFRIPFGLLDELVPQTLQFRWVVVDANHIADVLVSYLGVTHFSHVSHSPLGLFSN